LREQIHTLGLQKIGIGSDRQLDAVIGITVNNTRLMYEYSPAVFQGNVSFFEATEQKSRTGHGNAPSMGSLRLR